MMAGSNWAKAVTANTGRRDGEGEYDACDLCKKMKETSNHVWRCEALKGKRRELDIELAEADPEDLRASNEARSGLCDERGSNEDILGC